MKLTRKLLPLLGAAGALVLATGVAFAQAYKEAPMLAEMVKSGALPSVDKRLPEKPVVVKPLQSVGKYGGDFTTGLVGAGGSAHMSRFHAYDPLVRFSADWAKVEPNVAESWEINDTATEFTFHLRKGLKWSDGEPYTADDVMFWYNDVYNDPDIKMPPPNWLSAGGKKATYSKVDDLTFKVTFAAPNGFFLQNIAWGNNDQMTRFPLHYLKQFHAKYNPDADKNAKAAGLTGWPQLFEQKAGVALIDNAFRNPDMPVLTAWKMKVPMGKSTTQVVTERNPYYWKVDPDGNQLPYFDHVDYALVTDEQVLLLKVMQGEIDMIDQYTATPNNKSVLFDNQKAGGYKFYDLLPTEPNQMVIQLNLTHPDKVKRELYGNRDFRVALSYGLNRKALIDAVFVGEGEPAQPSILVGDSLYNERLAKQYTEFDPAKANAILDKIIPKKNADGIRLDAQGRPVTIVFELDNARQTFLDMFQLIVPMWKDIGIDTQIRSIDRSLWEIRVRRGFEYDATAHRFGGSTGQAALLDARYFVPNDGNSLFARGWQVWFQKPDDPNAVEPTAKAKEMVALYKQVTSTADPAKQIEIFKKVLDMNADEFYLIGITQPGKTYGIVKTNIVNVPSVMPNSFGYPQPGPTHVETFYRK